MNIILRIKTPMSPENYIWPVSRKETVKVGQALIDRLPTVLNKIYSKQSLSSRCVMNASGRFSIDAISLIIAESIKSRVSPDALSSANLKKSPFLISDNDPKETFDVFTIKILRNGLVKPPAWKEQLRPLKSILLRDGYDRQK